MNNRSDFSKLHILSVDDSPLIKNIISTILSEVVGAKHVDHAYNLVEAFSIISSQEIDVVLLDISLKQESGFELLEFIKKHHKKIKVIMVSNLSEKYYREKSMEMGADDYIDKSEDMEKIPGLIMKYID